MAGWAAARPVLRGEVPLEAAPVALPPPAALPANERRRTTEIIRLALAVAEEALSDQTGDFASVFATSEGDLYIVDRICRALLMPERPVSPTLFHNSVHNAPAGYLSIARHNPAPYSSLSAVDGSVAAGLLEAVTQVVTEGTDVLLVAYDGPPPEPLYGKRPIAGVFGAALLLTPDGEGATGARLGIAPATGETEPTPCSSPALERMRTGNPAARILPLLSALAAEAAQTIILPGLGGSRLRVEVQP